jgi:hypothetical protein
MIFLCGSRGQPWARYFLTSNPVTILDWQYFKNAIFPQYDADTISFSKIAHFDPDSWYANK